MVSLYVDASVGSFLKSFSIHFILEMARFWLCCKYGLCSFYSNQTNFVHVDSKMSDTRFSFSDSNDGLIFAIVPWESSSQNHSTVFSMVL